MFETTRWSLVVAARSDCEAARVALEELCRIYRPAVLAYVRGRGHSRSDAEDLTQGFFARFIEKRLHHHAEASRGRFRGYLLTSLRNYMVNAAEFESAARRSAMAVDTGTAPEELPTAEGEGPERAFERAWALALVQRVFRRLRDEADAAGRGGLYRRLQPFLLEAPDGDDYARVAAEFGMRSNTVAVAAHRLRQRMRALAREEIAVTVADEAEVDAEYRDIAGTLRALRGDLR